MIRVSWRARRQDDMGATMPIAAGALLLLSVATWVVSLPLRDVSIVDVAWGLGFVVVAWIAVAAGGGAGARPVLAAALTTVWGLRLAGHVTLRKTRERREDPRYGAWRERHGERFALVSLGSVFLFQGALIWVVSLPIQGTGSSSGALGVLDVLGGAAWLVGLVFEAGGDLQLARFKADPANRGKVMDRGLWRYTRHPNYFGDFMVWWGLYLVALAGGAWWALPGPLVVSVLLVRVSGKGLLEKTMARREGYADYVERTSGFVPLPPRGSSR
jgi:steroid 5-alpha reductase family enzyme